MTHVIVTGIVQGVFFRDYTYRQASKLNLTGWVRNLPDRTVEALFCGKQKDIETMLAWLKQGSPRSRVDNLTIEQITVKDNFSTFEVHY